MSARDATVWVETDAPCEVEILGARDAHLPGRGPPLRARRTSRASNPAGRHAVRGALDGERCWPPPTADWPPSVHPDAGAGEHAAARFRLVPGAPPARAALDADQGRRRPGPRDRRALRVLALRMREQPTPTTGRTCCCCSATRSTPTRSRPRPREFIRARRDTEQPPGARGRRLRGVHAPLPGVVGRPGDPLAAVDGPERDDLRRPRRPRRLEHLAAWLEEMRARAVVGRAHRRRVHVVLGLPAHRQPRRRASCDEDPCYRRVAQPTATPARRCATSRYRADREAAARAGATAATSATRGWWCIDSRAGRVLEPGARSMVDDQEWDWIDEHAHGRRRPPADRRPRCRCSGAGHPPPGGVERGASATAPGAAWPRGSASGSAGRSTSSTGPRSATRSSALSPARARSPRAQLVRRRRRS